MHRKIKFLLKNTPVYLIFWVTQNCNLKCSYCFNYRENEKENQDLTINEIELFSRHLKHIKYLTLAGGEPFLRQDLAAIAAIFYRNNDLHVLNIVTNGWFTEQAVSFAKAVLTSCPGLYLSIVVSIDGPRDIHDRMRDRKGSFDRAIATVRELQKLSSSGSGRFFSVAASGTYTRDNCHVMLDTAKYLAGDLGITYYVDLIRGKDIRDNTLKDIDIDHFYRTSKEIRRLTQQMVSPYYPFRVFRNTLEAALPELIYDSFRKNKMTAGCKAGKRGFVLTANGDIILCEMLNIVLGNIREHEYDPLAVLRSPQALSEMKKISDRGCHCTWECFQRMNLIYSPFFYARIAGRMLNPLRLLKSFNKQSVK